MPRLYALNRVRIYLGHRCIALPHKYTRAHAGTLIDREQEREREAIREKLKEVMREEEEKEEGERQTLEIVGVLEKRGVWNERVNLQRNRLASYPSIPVLQSKAQIQHSETHMLSRYTHMHTHNSKKVHPTLKQAVHTVHMQNVHGD